MGIPRLTGRTVPKWEIAISTEKISCCAAPRYCVTISLNNLNGDEPLRIGIRSVSQPINTRRSRMQRTRSFSRPYLLLSIVALLFVLPAASQIADVPNADSSVTIVRQSVHNDVS